MLYRKPNCYKYLKDKRLFFIQTNKKFCSILLYCALPFEVQVNRIIAFLRKKKIYYVLVPRIIKNDLKMVEFRLPLAKNYFHIKEPQSKIIERMTTIDIAVVPVLGVDKDLKRVGFGKGMYDRFYATLRVKPYSIFVSRKKNISDASLCNDYDIQADIYISGRS
ncbi:5-formyltetrahydrofolate cyclo-ligase [Helicobacter aurati]|uniref:5-formyltetrahydrofolate cyclo-ligase n=2 Tax=Helicobacter aurati TaxID=137778 RepID=A0A3D8JA99_9HELI|nr:5-formyltetrahydrofolate cyclo-ligase [Helicobacter aurati]